MQIIYISLPLKKKYFKFEKNTTYVYSYEIIDFLYSIFREYFNLEEWTYEYDIHKCYQIMSMDKSKVYKFDEPIMHKIVTCLPNYRLHKNCIEVIMTDESFLRQHLTIFQDREIEYQHLKEHFETFYRSEIGNQHKTYGFIFKDKYLIIREWIPNIKKMKVIFNFKKSDEVSYDLVEESSDIWSVQILRSELHHNMFENNDIKSYRYYIETFTGENILRMSPYTQQYIQINAFSHSPTFESLIHIQSETSKYKFKHPHINNKTGLKIYETHIGIAQKEKCIGTYSNFTKNILPYIKNIGYNCIQIMGILEHPHYSTFGYQPNFVYAPSSRFGSHDDLKELIDTAHGMNIKVILDIITGHSCPNEDDGLKNFNGISNCFFQKEQHPLWRCEMFNFENMHVFNYMLSALNYWIEEYMVDGFRFDAVTAIIYKHFGVNKSATELSHDFFNKSVNLSGLNFLRYANEFLHKKYGDFIVTIAEEVSGFPGLCSKYGLGFDYRLGMHIPDIIQKLFPVDINYKPLYKYDEFDVQLIADYFIKYEKNPMITYVESHDQAFVGSCTLFNAIAGKSAIIPKDLAAVPFNKRRHEIRMAMQFSMIFRLLAFSVSGQGYLTFMGNEFGHPQWIEFPSIENNLSFDKCHRKWNLIQNKNMIFQYLLQYERELHKLSDTYRWLDIKEYKLIYVDNQKQIMIYKKLHQIFIVNFHTRVGYKNVYIPIHAAGNYRVIHSTSDMKYNGTNKIPTGTIYKSYPVNSSLMRDTRISRSNEKKYYEDYFLNVPVEPMSAYIIQSMITENILMSSLKT